jgi:diguanylate cyclase (GGDEF)-like protein
LREGDIAARLGGDEFVIALAAPMNEESASAITERAVRRVASPYQLGDQIVQLSASAGLSLCQGVEDIDTFLKRADQAMYKAKRDGTGVVIASSTP